MFERAVINRAPADQHVQTARARGHHRAGVRTVPARRLLAPAAPRGARVAEQRVARGGEARGNPVEHVVEARGGPAEAQIARRAVTPHGVERVGEAKAERAGAARDREPEERAEDRVVAVFQRRFDGGARQRGFVGIGGFARDDPRRQQARLAEVALRERARDRFDVIVQAARAEREPQQRDVHGARARKRQHGDEPPGDQHRRQHGQRPREQAP